MSYQETCIVGNLGAEPESRFTPSGQQVTNFSMATNRSYTKADGEKVKEVTWFRISAWGKLGEIADKYLSQGSQVMVKGRLKSDPATGGPKLFVGKDGVTRASFEIDAKEIIFLKLEKKEEVASGGDDGIPF